MDAAEAVERYVEDVLALVESVPAGRVTTYGAIAAHVGGGPRRVGSVMARHGAAVPWWRVVRADGTLPPDLAARAAASYDDEGTPRSSRGVPSMVQAFWDPAQPSEATAAS